MGATQVDQFQPGSKVARPTTDPSTVTNSTLPFSNVLNSPGALNL